MARPFIVGIECATRPALGSERVLHLAMEAAMQRGADTQVFSGDLFARGPIADAATVYGATEVQELVSAVRRADGLIIASPPYHGSVSEMVKSALDALEKHCHEKRPFFDGRTVAAIVVADSGQAGATTLAALKRIIHAMGGWPIPSGLSLDGFSGNLFSSEGNLADPMQAAQLSALVDQVVSFARARSLSLTAI